MDESDQRKLNAIVGAAVKALAESGADDEFVGAFAMSHREKVSKILGVPAAPPPATDLLALVTEAVRQAMATAPSAQSHSTRARRGGSERIYVTVAGKPTSLTLETEMLEKVRNALGGRKQARKALQELAQSAPADVKNRSGWVAERAMTLVTASATGRVQQRH